MASHNMTMVRTIAATAAITLLFTATLFFLYHKCYVSRRRRANNNMKGSFRRGDVMMSREGMKKPCKNPKEANACCGHEVDGFSARKLEGGQLKGNNFPKFVFNPSYKDDKDEEEDKAEEKRVLDAEGETKREKFRPQEASLLHEVSDYKPVLHNPTPPKPNQALQIQQKPSLPPQTPRASFALTPPIVPKKAPNLASHVPPKPLQTSSTLTPPSPSPPPPPQNPPPPPPPPPPPLRPLPMAARARSSLPPPMPKASGWISSRRTPIAPRGREAEKSNKAAESLREESSNGNNAINQMKLKPLHWDKVTADVDHSTVWDEINDGSLRFDDELMENLFGYSTTNRQSSERTNIFSAFAKTSSSPPTQIFLLDPRKSQNTAIVLRSLAISRREILDALTEGQELSTETLEKLTKIAPTKEEASKILQFDGNPSKLADAESFLFHILKAVPSAFDRLDAMLFRANYDGEILHFKESLQTLEAACRELRSRGLFLKLLEAILKAGNKMNEGTSRGNAQGFNLNALKKLSDIRSNDGKTTLLHFVVEQVARSEGKSQQQQQEDEDDRSRNESLLSGLSLLEGLSTKELSNVKRAATVEHQSLAALCAGLGAKAAEVRRLSRDRDGDREWFAREMEGFVEECEEEIEVAREEERRVVEVVKRTTEYYQAESSRSSPFRIFVVVKDFLDVVDQVCAEIGRKYVQQQKKDAARGSASPPLSPSTVTPRRFPASFRSHFMSDASLSSTESESEDGFFEGVVVGFFFFFLESVVRSILVRNYVKFIK